MAAMIDQTFTQQCMVSDNKPKVVDYGYGDASPDSAAANTTATAATTDSDLYGYGDATPDSAVQQHHDYASYGRQSSNVSGASSTQDDRAKYGYGDDDAAKYGYGESEKEYKGL